VSWSADAGALGGSAGFGTVLFVAGIGPAVELALRLLRVELPAGRGGRPRRREGAWVRA
jgi:uncharacterized membrane protein YczE